MWRSSLVAAMLIAILAASASADEPAKPTLAPIVEKPAFQFTKCAVWCWTRNVVDRSPESVVVALRRVPTGTDIQATGARLALQSDQDDDVRAMPGTFQERSGEAEQDRITVDPKPSDLPPGHYSGSLVFDVSSGADPVAVPVGLDVRAGPEWPLVVLIASVLGGALLGLLLNQRPRVKFKKSADALHERIVALPVEERDILLPLWDTLWKERGDASGPTKLAALEKGADALVRCRNMQDKALRSPQAVVLPGWIRRIGVAVHGVIEAVRSFEPAYDDKLAVVAGAVDEFKVAAEAEIELKDLEVRARPAKAKHQMEHQRFTKAVDEARAALAGVPAQPSEPAPDLVSLLKTVTDAFKALETAYGSALEPPATGDARAAGLGGVEGLAVSLLGWPVRQAAAEEAEAGTGRGFDVGAWFGAKLGPLAAGAVALVLLAVGFKLTYLDNATFGAKLTDWLALVFWGLAAWGVRQTLTGIGPAPAPAG